MGARKRIGVYNRHWASMGGGEKYAGTIAEILSRDHDVELITYQALDAVALGDKLELDLSRVKMRVIPDMSDEYTTDKVTADYDLFINSSYMTALASKAKRSALFVFFPASFTNDLSALQRFAATIARGIVKQMVRDEMEYIDGFTDYDLDGMTVKLLAGLEGTIRLPVWKQERASLVLNVVARGKESASLQCYLNGTKAGEPVTFASGSRQSISIPLDRELLVHGENTVQLQASTADSIVIGGAAMSPGFKFRLRAAMKKLPSRVANMPKNLDYLKSYDRIAAISEYSRSWMKKSWGLDSELLFPPVSTDVGESRAAARKNIIVSVGRFFTGGHSKKQLEMVEVFKELCDAGLVGWEYHLAGGTHAEHREYLDKVRQAADGYPVFFHTDCTRKTLDDLYAQAKIFWHAAGYGENPDTHPEMFEHFGITTVEAMAFGVVPVVFPGGGQAEVVEDGVTGLHWRTPDELMTKTRELCASDDLLSSLSPRARAASSAYSKTNFTNKLAAILESLSGTA